MKKKDKARGPHIVPLPPQLLATLREWRKADGESSSFVCPSSRGKRSTLTPAGIDKYYRQVLRLASIHSPHSWRSAFSTVCRDAGKDGDVVEAQLDHVVGTATASAYDRAKRLELRRELMMWYEATLIAARDGAEVMPIKNRRA
jgi:integrase